MAINLDEIVAGSNSMDELLAAISSESDSNAKATTQLAQLRQAAQGIGNPTSLIKSRVTASAPKPAASQGNPEDMLYQKYVEATATNGQQPISQDDFIKAVEAHKAKLTSNTGSK